MITLDITHIGNKQWRYDNIFHRANGPAVISVNGTKLWYLHGLLHRANGPAVVKGDYFVATEIVQLPDMYYWHGRQLTEYETMMITTPKITIE